MTIQEPPEREVPAEADEWYIVDTDFHAGPSADVEPLLPYIESDVVRDKLETSNPLSVPSGIEPAYGSEQTASYHAHGAASNGEDVREIIQQLSLDEVIISPGMNTLPGSQYPVIKTALWRVLLCLSAQLHDPSGYAAIDATFFDRENASKHYCRWTNYRVPTLKTTAFVDTESHAILDVQCPTEKMHDTQFGWQVARVAAGGLASLAANKGYDWMELSENLREEGVRRLIKHQEFQPLSHAHNQRIDGYCYRQRSTCKPSSPH